MIADPAVRALSTQRRWVKVAIRELTVARDPHAQTSKEDGTTRGPDKVKNKTLRLPEDYCSRSNGGLLSDRRL